MDRPLAIRRTAECLIAESVQDLELGSGFKFERGLEIGVEAERICFVCQVDTIHKGKSQKKENERFISSVAPVSGVEYKIDL